MTTNIQAQKQRASELRKGKQIAPALEIYRDLWTNHRAECDEWDGWGYAYCLRKLKKPKEALAVCEAVHNIKPDFAYINGEYAWCLYELEIKKDIEQVSADEAAFFRAASLIIKLVPQDKFSARAKTVLEVVDYLKSKNNTPSDSVIEWLNQLDPKKLSTDAFAFTDNDGKQRELASDQERWYANMTQALEHAGKWQECIGKCDEALTIIKTFHYDNNVWIRRRRAIAIARMGRKDEALAELEALVKVKKEWFIQYEIAVLLFELGKVNEALLYATGAALNAGDPDKKLDLYLFMSSVLSSLGKAEEARSHLALSFKLRQEHGWRIPAALQEQLANTGLDVNQIPDSQTLIRKLRSYWQSVQRSNQTRYNGSISQLNTEAGFGFIETSKGESHYFRLNEFRAPRRNLREGLKVNFALEPGYDKRKQRETMNAVDVIPEE